MADGKVAYSFEKRQPIVVDGKFISRLYPMKDKNLRINRALKGRDACLYPLGIL